jgi:hypothetical protein
VTGLKNTGHMRSGRIGKGTVGGQLVGPVMRDSLEQRNGHIDRDAVAKVINEHLHEVSACYEKALLSNPGLNGKLAFEWVIGPSGTVKVKSGSLKDATVASCIATRIKSWPFPRPRGGAVMVSYPFFFQATGF